MRAQVSPVVMTMIFLIIAIGSIASAYFIMSYLYEKIAVTVIEGEKDTDNDGLSDTEEEELGTDPEDSDTDGDGLEDKKELELGTDPNDIDTDGDGVSDGDEVKNGTDPLI